MVQNTATNDEATNDHPAADIETIVVDPADIVTMIRRNWRDQDETLSHSLRITPPFTGTVRAAPHVSQQGSYYPPKMAPKPIHLGKAAFLAGNSMDRSSIPDACHFPNMHDSRARFREEFGYYGANGENRRLTDDEEEEWEEWWDVELEVWEEAVRAELCDETELMRRSAEGNQTTTVEVRYEER